MNISTKPSPKNIEKIVGTLVGTPAHLQILSQECSAGKLSAPLTPSQWSFVEVLAHLNACAELATHAIFYALLEDNPVLPDVHPSENGQSWFVMTSFHLQICSPVLLFAGQSCLKSYPPCPKWSGRALCDGQVSGRKLFIESLDPWHSMKLITSRSWKPAS